MSLAEGSLKAVCGVFGADERALWGVMRLRGVSLIPVGCLGLKSLCVGCPGDEGSQCAVSKVFLGRVGSWIKGCVRGKVLISACFLVLSTLIGIKPTFP